MHSTPCLTAPVGVQISTGVHPGGQNICWGAPHWQEEKNLAGVHPGSQIHWLGVPCQPTRINSGCNHFANFAYFAVGCQETFQTFSGVTLFFSNPPGKKSGCIISSGV